MGRMQREKGKRFERRIANVFRERWPGVEFRRSSQAERAHNSDVFAVGNPFLERMWFELQDARAPRPEAKLAQAELDIMFQPVDKQDRWPVVVWHKLGAKVEHVTTRLWVLDDLRTEADAARAGSDAIVTMELATFLDLAKGALPQ